MIGIGIGTWAVNKEEWDARRTLYKRLNIS